MKFGRFEVGEYIKGLESGVPRESMGVPHYQSHTWPVGLPCILSNKLVNISVLLSSVSSNKSLNLIRVLMGTPEFIAGWPLELGNEVEGGAVWWD